MTLSLPRRIAASTAAALLLSLTLMSAATAQVATLSDPAEEAEASPIPAAEAPEGEEAILAFASCMRENDIDMDDPQFGVSGGGFFGPPPSSDGEGPGFDVQSPAFQAALEACSPFLEALRPDLDPEQEAEIREGQLALAACMRGSDFDFPDPDPNGGFGFRRGDGALDFSDPAFQEAFGVCQQEAGLGFGPRGPGGG